MDSSLSGSGCDFVVATTQASINKGLLDFLEEETQPLQYLCFLQDDHGYPTKQISLEDLLTRTKGVNPFYIPAGTDPNDPRLLALDDAEFGAGIVMQMGIPPGYSRVTLPPIISLQNGAQSVIFNLFCKQVTAVSIKYGRRGSIIWNVFEQPSGQAWSAKMLVNLSIQDLRNDLNNSPYFKTHPKEREELEKALENLSGTAFSLQQLIFDLDNGFLESAPDFGGVSDPDVKSLLEGNFRDIYSKTAREQGLPLAALAAVSQEPDPSSLQMTSFERNVTHSDDGDGSASTLNYLCAINNHPRPSSDTAFNWKWVQPQEMGQESGVIAINRQTFVQYLADTLKESDTIHAWQIRRGDNSKLWAKDNVPVDLVISKSGSNVIHGQNQDKFRLIEPDEHRPNAFTATSVASYTIDITFEGQVLGIKQYSDVYIYGGFTNPNDPHPQATIKVFQLTLEESFALSVDSDGTLELKSSGKVPSRDTKVPEITYDPDADPDAIKDVLGDYIDDLLALDFGVSDLGELRDVSIPKVHNFIFPSSKVFKYADPFFSKDQDIVCPVSYS